MVGCFPALASANQGAVRPPGPPYTQPGRITSPRTPDACSTSCSCAGRHAASLTGFRGVVSSTMRSPVSPCTQAPLVKMRVLDRAPRRPVSISASIAFLSLATRLAESSKAAWTSAAHSAATSAYVLGSPRSPMTGSISCCASRGAFASLRVRPQTRCPARRNAVATLQPTYPVAPVTNTCMGAPVEGCLYNFNGADPGHVLPSTPKERPMAAEPPTRTKPASSRALRDHVLQLLGKGHAHVTFEDAIAAWPAELRGAKPASSPTTTPITWDSWCCCDACSALGKGTRVTGNVLVNQS